MVKAYNHDLDPPFLALARLLDELMKDVDRENVPTPTRYMSPKRQIPSVDLDPPSREMSPPIRV